MKSIDSTLSEISKNFDSEAADFLEKEFNNLTESRNGYERYYHDAVAVLKELSALSDAALKGTITPEERIRLDVIVKRFL